MYRFDPTGKVSRSSSLVVAEDNFKTGLDDWLQLYTPATAGDGTKWGTVTHTQRGGRRLIARTPNIADYGVMALKRMSTVFGEGKYLLELMVNFELPAPFGDPLERPRYFSFGVDACKADGSRRYFKVRYLVYDEGTTTAVHKMQWADLAGSGTFTDMTGGAINLLVENNENKSLPIYIALEVDTSTGTYEGFRVNNDLRVGSLAESPDNTVSALGVLASGTLLPYAGGLNSCVEIQNRSAAGFTAGTLGIQFHRLTYLGA